MSSLVPRPSALRAAQPSSASVALTAVTIVLALLLGSLAATPARAEKPDPVGVWPLDPRPEVVSAFDPPDDPWGAGHRGVDLAGRIGQPVRSALPGVVAFAGSIAGKPVVSVSHGDTRTTYEPVVASVAVGTRVAAGAVLGVLDLPASHCSPWACLHWGWRRGDTYLDPLALVGGGPVRLLPLWRDEPVASGGWRPPTHPYAAWSPPAAAGTPPGTTAPVVSPPGGRPVGHLP